MSAGARGGAAAPGYDASPARRGLLPAFDRLERPPADAIPPASSSLPLGRLAEEIDDATAAYVLATQAPFDLLRQAISQFAGVMVLAAAGARNDAAPDILDRVRDEQAEANDGIRICAADAPQRAAHHHRHLTQACAALGVALRAARDGDVRRGGDSLDDILTPLNAAYRHLQWATGALPGFEVVALSQGCCAAHVGLRAPARNRGDE
jgi:hypothetical protein